MLRDVEGRLGAAREGRTPLDEILTHNSPLRHSDAGRSDIPDTIDVEVLARSDEEMKLRQTAVGRLWSVDIDGDELSVDRRRSVMVLEWSLRRVDGTWLVHDRVLVQRRMVIE